MDPEAMARIVQGLIPGMAFIGGEAILRQSDRVKGTAMAALPRRWTLRCA